MSSGLQRPRRPVRRLRRALRDELRHARRTAAASPPDVHAARRHLKRARALIRLGRAGWPDGGRTLDRRLRDAGRALGRVRDTEARVEALEALRSRPETADPDLLDVALGRLRDERDRARAAQAAAPDAVRHIRKAQAHLRAHPPRGRGRGAALFEAGLGAMLAAGGKAARRALARADDPAAWHAVRKRAKDLRYAVEFLEPAWPPVLGALADELHTLTDRLGDANDLTLVLDRLARDPAVVAPGVGRGVARMCADARRARWQAAVPQVRRIWAPEPAAAAAVLVAWG